MSAVMSGKLRQPSVPRIVSSSEIELRIEQDQRHRRDGIDFAPVQFQRARPIFDLRNIEHGELQRFADLLRGEADAVRRVHRLEHVGGKRANAIVDFLDRVCPCARRIGSPYFAIGNFISRRA